MSDDSYTPLGDTKALDEVDMASFKHDGKKIAVARVDGTLYAFDDLCTHAGCPLTPGGLEGKTILCLCHRSKFDITDGSVIQGPAFEPLGTYKVRDNNGTLEVAL